MADTLKIKIVQKKLMPLNRLSLLNTITKLQMKIWHMSLNAFDDADQILLCRIETQLHHSFVKAKYG